MSTRQQAAAGAAARLRAAGIDTARLDADLLLAHVLEVTRDALYVDPALEIDPAVADAFEALVARRLAREPVAHLLGVREFWSLRFEVSPATLVPRPDTETLVEAVLEYVRDTVSDWPLRILDLGTGTGCVLLALLHELPEARGLGIDVAPEAIRVADRNAEALGIGTRCEFRAGDWFSAVHEGERFNLMVANPPYIREGDLPALEPEVREYESNRALVAGPDGLDAYRAILAGAAGASVEGGSVWLEIGEGQGADVRGIARQHGHAQIAMRQDLAGVERVLGFRLR